MTFISFHEAKRTDYFRSFHKIYVFRFTRWNKCHIHSKNVNIRQSLVLYCKLCFVDENYKNDNFIILSSWKYIIWSTLTMYLANMFKPSSNFLTDCSKAVLLLWILFLFLFHVCLCHTVWSFPCSLVVTCWERADLLALWYMMFSFVLSLHFPIWCPGSGVVLDCIDSWCRIFLTLVINISWTKIQTYGQCYYLVLFLTKYNKTAQTFLVV